MPDGLAKRFVVIAFRNRSRQFETGNIDAPDQLPASQRLCGIWQLLDDFGRTLDACHFLDVCFRLALILQVCTAS